LRACADGSEGLEYLVGLCPILHIHVLLDLPEGQRGDKTTAGIRNPRRISLSSENELPTSFRGYDRAATHAFLARVEENYRGLVAERDELLNRVEALERELNEFREQHHAAGRALVRVEQLRVEAERDAEAIRSEAQRAASMVQEHAERAAEAAVRDAEALMNTAKEQLTRLVRGLFERAGAARSLENGSNGSHQAFAEEPSRSDHAPS
jgi:cell division septum initiation protein DivIVA